MSDASPAERRRGAGEDGRRPAVSVVLPTFDRAASLRRAIDSVLRQTFEDFELIVVDDGSRDATPEILADIRDPRLRVVRRKVNAGANAARNDGVRAARADWVAFQDSDDEWLTEKLALQIERLRADSASRSPEPVAVYGALLSIDRPADGRRPKVAWLPLAPGPYDGDVAQALLAGNLASTQTLLARRDALIDAGLFDESLPAMQDWDMALRLARRGPFAYLDTPLAIQTLSRDSLTRSRPKRVEAYLMILEKHADAFAARPDLLAEHHRALAIGCAALGRRLDAARHGRRALAAYPWRLRWWARILLALIAGSAGARA